MKRRYISPALIQLDFLSKEMVLEVSGTRQDGLVDEGEEDMSVKVIQMTPLDSEDDW